MAQQLRAKPIKKLIRCDKCSKEFYRVGSRIRKHNYCSSICSALDQGRRYPLGCVKDRQCSNDKCDNMARLTYQGQELCDKHYRHMKYNNDPIYHARKRRQDDENNTKHRKRINTYVHEYQANKRVEFLNIIVGEKNMRCRICNFNDMRFLDAHHIRGGGTEDRARFGSQLSYYNYYISHPDEAREKLEILCRHCNLGKNRKY